MKNVQSNECVWPCTKRSHMIVLSVNADTNVKDGQKILTVELYEKWYGLILYSFGNSEHGEVYEELDFGVLTEFNTPYFCDHCPNPTAVEKFAKAKGYYLDPLAFELIVGRWETEVGHYS